LSDPRRLALAGMLAGYSGLTRGRWRHGRPGTWPPRTRRNDQAGRQGAVPQRPVAVVRGEDGLVGIEVNVGVRNRHRAWPFFAVMVLAAPVPGRPAPAGRPAKGRPAASRHAGTRSGGSADLILREPLNERGARLRWENWPGGTLPPRIPRRGQSLHVPAGSPQPGHPGIRGSPRHAGRGAESWSCGHTAVATKRDSLAGEASTPIFCKN
jgi:hypothetical protein